MWNQAEDEPDRNLNVVIRRASLQGLDATRNSIPH